MNKYIVNDKNYLEHSKGPWKNHKYIRIDKIKGVPRYIYDKAGGAAKKDLEEKDKDYRKAEEEYENAKEMTAEELANRGVSVREREVKAERKGQEARAAAEKYYSTPLGKLDSVTSRARDFISEHTSKNVGTRAATPTPVHVSGKTPVSRKKNVTGAGKGAYKRGSGFAPTNSYGQKVPAGNHGLSDIGWRLITTGKYKRVKK